MKATHKKLCKNIVRISLLVICGIILGFNIYNANARKLVGDGLPMPLGIGSAVVLSGSMEPELSKGDMIFVKEADSYKEGDVVVYQEGSILVVHRIIEIDGENVIAKGDANQSADEPVNISAIKGKVCFTVPFVGNIINIIKTPVGTICIIVMAIALIEIPRLREKKKDDEERQKMIDEIKRLKDEE